LAPVIIKIKKSVWGLVPVRGEGHKERV
jgi:hypothetical protein